MEPGTRLGQYEILDRLGAGGMGEVYRARDTTLDRDVAIKVLPEDFADDANRLARFEREAKLLASLNHPNIATIFGFEESDGVRFIAMELVEGVQPSGERTQISTDSGGWPLWSRDGAAIYNVLVPATNFKSAKRTSG